MRTRQQTRENSRASGDGIGDFDRDLEPIDIPNRNPRMPGLYKAKKHPLHPRTNPGNSYVYYTRPTHARMQELLQAGESMLKDDGSDPVRGMLELKPGDYLWTRNEVGTREPKDDVPVNWILGQNKRSQSNMKALDVARAKFMGPEDELTEKSVHFERLKPTPKPVKKGTRCFTLGSSLEPNTNVEAPCANGKWLGSTTEYHEIVQDVVRASTRLAMEDMSHGPEEVKEILKSEFDRHGMGPLGCAENYAYHSVQCNLAYVGSSLDQQMGRRFGGSHKDGNDCPGHYSTIISRSRLPENYQPPLIILPGVGVYTKLYDFVGSTFQAQHEHVGTNPYPSNGTPSTPNAYRFALIHYTPQRMATAETRQRIGALPNMHALLAPEMRSSQAEKDIIKGLQKDSFANFIRDGVWLMEDEGYVHYVGRILYQFNRYLLKQSPERLRFDIDPVMLARAITYQDPDGNRKSVEPWSMAPSVLDHGECERDVIREESEERFKEFIFKHGSMIPLYLNRNAWIREEVLKRYGIELPPLSHSATVGALADAQGGTMQQAGSRGNRRGGTAMGDNMEVDDDRDGNAGSYNLRKRKRNDSIDEADETDKEDDVRESDRAGQGFKQGGPPKRKRTTAQVETPNEDCDETYNNGSPPEGTTVVKAKHRGRKGFDTNSENGFKLIRLLSVDTLEEEVLDLRRELHSADVIDEDDDETFEDVRDVLDDANTAIELGGIGRKALRGISTVMQDGLRLASHIGREENKLRMSRMTLVKAQTGVRLWVEGPVAGEAAGAARRARPQAGKQSWVSSLTNDVISMLVNRERTKVFKGFNYGIEWECTEAVVDNPHEGRIMLRGMEETVRAATAITTEIVEKWTDVNAQCDKKQAWFASIVEEVMGEEALTLNVVWRLYNNLKVSHVIIGDKGYRNPTRNDMEPFRATLQNHSVLDTDHREGQLFDLYKRLLNGEIGPSDVVKTLPSVSPRWNALQRMIELASTYDKDEDEEPIDPPAYFKKLQADPTTYHPLRERSPGRVRCRRDLFDGKTTISQSTVFSLIVWRSFPQVFSWHPDSSMFYAGPVEFLDAHRRILKDEPSEAMTSAANKYWVSLGERRWSNFAETYPTFEECYQHFKPSGHLETRLYPRLSRTDAFDVTCDLAYAGFCRPPTTAEVAKYIVHINQGAMSGLKALGLVDGKKRDIDSKRSQVAQALEDLMDLLRSNSDFMDSFEDDVDATYNVYPGTEADPIRVEHLLRTFSHSLKYLLA